MLPYQEEYIENIQRILGLNPGQEETPGDFESWLEDIRQRESDSERIKSRNMEILERELFPVLDNLYSASEETLRQLGEFADKLLDWKSNLDKGVSVRIHDALLSLYRMKKDRNSVIKELYKLGMGLFYLDRMVMGIDGSATKEFFFENEMLFTEASSYLRFFDEIEDDETRGYIIRSLHNIAICSRGFRKKIAASAKALNVVKDEHYRAVAPSLPWDAFLRGVNQQMSSNRAALSDMDLTTEELALVLDSCYEVFKPEQASGNPNIRWVWPYYEMEYTCGYVDLKTTVSRIEDLNGRVPADQHDVSGLYGNIQLPIHYGRLLQGHPELIEDPSRVSFLTRAYDKMFKCMMSFPLKDFGDQFLYDIILVVSDFYEIEGSVTYREVVTALMKRFSRGLYVRSRKMGDIMAQICAAILDSDPAFFDSNPYVVELRQSGVTDLRDRILSYAADCGLFHDFGLVKMNIWRTLRTRELLDREFSMYRLHTVSGYGDLKGRASTRHFADIALGHHSWYNGEDDYTPSYERTASAYRQMTDVAAVASYIIHEYRGDMAPIAREISSQSRKRFSPYVAACFLDDGLVNGIARILDGDDREYLKEVYETIALN